MTTHLRTATLLLAAVLCAFGCAACAPDTIEGTVLEQEWSAYDMRAALRITSGDVVTVRFPLAVHNRAGFDEARLRRDSLAGKTVRIALDAGLTVRSCVLLLPDGERRLWRVGEGR